MKKLVLLIVCLGAFTVSFSQTKEELQAQKAEKQAAADVLQGEANAIQAQIDALPGWRTGAFGTLGANISGYNNWFSRGAVNNSSGNIGQAVARIIVNCSRWPMMQRFCLHNIW